MWRETNLPFTRPASWKKQSRRAVPRYSAADRITVTNKFRRACKSVAIWWNALFVYAKSNLCHCVEMDLRPERKDRQLSLAGAGDGLHIALCVRRPWAAVSGSQEELNPDGGFGSVPGPRARPGYDGHGGFDLSCEPLIGGDGDRSTRSRVVGSGWSPMVGPCLAAV